MFSRRRITYSGFSDYSNIKKIVSIAIVFVIIAAIWAGYFLIKYYSGSDNFNLKGTIYYKTRPLPDVNVSVSGASVVSDENGAFIIPHLPLGSVVVKFEKKGFVSLEEKVFLWRKNQEMDKITLTRDENFSASFSGTVLNNFDKRPIANAIIHLGNATATSDETGLFEFIDMPKENSSLTISAVGFWDLTEDINLAALGSGPKEYNLTPYGRVSFTSLRDGKKNIYAINYDGKNLTNLTSKIKGDCWGGVFAPSNGSLIFYSDFEGITDQWGQKIPALYLLEKGSDKPIKISRDVIPEGEFKISRNGTRIVFPGKKKNEDKIEIYLAGIAKKEEWAQLTDNDLTESNLDISPDGNQVIYGVFNEGVREIYSQKIGSFTDKKISASPNRETFLSYSPDGKSILYVRETPDLRSQIFIYDVVKQKEKEIYKTSTNIQNIVWNKSSDKIVFTSIRDDKDNIYSIDTSGENEIKLTDQGANYKDILWPDLEKILVFMIKKDNGNSLAVMDISHRTIHEIENISDDVLSWDSEVFDTVARDGL
ncbi:MAG: hypothetical protein PHU42_02520 [Patescibacteria group bacterium]|nr:hypothetical protein [Patescibacteria group bacterium]